MANTGFIAPPPEYIQQLSTLTEQKAICDSRGRYILEEDCLPEEYKKILHGRIFVIDRVEITANTENGAETYYIASDKVQGLIVPARSISIRSEINDSHYRWTDDGDRWTGWITLPSGTTHTYNTEEKCRFAELQIYSAEAGSLISLRAAR